MQSEMSQSRWGSVWAAVERVTTARRGAWALAVVVFVSLAFRVHVSRECSLWLDEMLTAQGISKPWPAVLKGPSPAHPPLMYVLLRAVVAVFGDGDTGLRSLSLFFGCVLLVATYELCLELRLSVGRALLVVGTLALTPFFIRHATEARHYAMLAALTTLATTRALRWLHGQARARDIVACAACILGAAWTHYFGLAYAAALLAALIVGGGPNWKQARAPQRVALLALLGALITGLALVALRAGAVGRRYTAPETAMQPGLTLNEDLAERIPREFSFIANEGWALAIEPTLALVGIVLLTLRGRGVARLLPLGIGVAPCLAALLIPSRHFLAPRYLAPSFVFYHLGSCVALFAASDRLRAAWSHGTPAARLAPLASGLVLAGLLGARLREYPEGFGAGLEDYRGLQRYIQTSLPPATKVVAYIGSYAREFYGKHYVLDSLPIDLERFRPVKGVERYLVVEIHVGDRRRARLEKLVKLQLGVSPQAWRSLPLVPIPHTIYQTPVSARLVQLPSDWQPPPPLKKRQRKK